MKLHRLFGICCVSSLLAVAVAGCGEKTEPSGTDAFKGKPDEIKLALDRSPNATHAGILLARSSGEFKKAGLALEVETPADPAAPLKLLQSGAVDLAISHEPELLLARDKDVDLVSVGALVQEPLTSATSSGTKIAGDEARVDKVGAPTHAGLIFVARRDSLKGPSAARFRRFLQASARAHRALKADPTSGVDALLSENPGLKRKPQAAAVDKALPTFFPTEKGKPFGYQRADQWAQYSGWMLRNKLLTKPAEVERAFTNDLLPGEGLDQG